MVATAASASASASTPTSSEAGPSSRPIFPHVRPTPIPDTTIVSVEYPGILSNSTPNPHPGQPSPLDKALSTLYPSSFPLAPTSAHLGLEFLSGIHNHNLRAVECRWAQYVDPAAPQSSIDPAELYRSPLIGEAVDTANLVIRITKRTWRKKRKAAKRISPPPSQQTLKEQPQPMDIDPQLIDREPNPTQPSALPKDSDTANTAAPLEDPYMGELRKEYKVEVLGVTTKTVRFRSMADFAYKPDLGPASGARSNDPAVPSSSSSSVATPAASGWQDPIVELHAALITMDLAKLRTFEMPAQHQDYTYAGADGATRSNLRMMPPAHFSRPVIPFRYNFQQHAQAEARMVARPRHRTEVWDEGRTLTTSQSDARQVQRIVNRVRLSNIAPQSYRVGKDDEVPRGPTDEVRPIEKRLSAEAMAGFRRMLEERPIWSRIAFINHLDAKQRFEIEGSNGKCYFALAGYAMVGGPWRDTIVRFGYDVRRDREARFYQRLFMRKRREWSVAATGGREGVVEGGGDGSTQRQQQQQPQQRYHIFTGTTLSRSTYGNFQLCDIVDPVVVYEVGRESR
ncbi:tau 95 subunit of transcription factor TFIIIC [Thecaphora frezii]